MKFRCEIILESDTLTLAEVDAAVRNEIEGLPITTFLEMSRAIDAAIKAGLTKVEELKP